MKLNLRIILAVLLLVTVMPLVHGAEVYENVKDVPDPMKGPRPGYVCDPDGFLDRASVLTLNQKLAALNRRGTVEMAVVVLNSIGDEDPVQFAVDLGTLWGVGKGSNSNGVMLLVVMESHRIALQTGYGMEGVLTDAVCSGIINKVMVPLMREDKLADALTSAVAKVSAIVSDPAAAEELKGEAVYDFDTEDLRMLFLGICAIAFVVGLVFYIRCVRASRRAGADWHERSKIWKESLVKIAICGALSLGAGLLIYLLALRNYRHWRTRRRRCPRCNAKMKRLGEVEDNAYLDSGQDLEEQLKSVDYDVWQCPECGEVERFAFVNSNSVYRPCPRCGVRAFAPTYERVLRQPTASADGKGLRVKTCRHCGYEEQENFNIPREDGGGATALAVGAAVLGGMARRGGGGGGSFGGGGGWGGGSFGGGGASGSW